MVKRNKKGKSISITLIDFISEEYVKSVPVNIYDDIFNSIRTEINDKYRIIIFGSLIGGNVTRVNF